MRTRAKSQNNFQSNLVEKPNYTLEIKMEEEDSPARGEINGNVFDRL
mgnify:CR=1 FL=1